MPSTANETVRKMNESGIVESMDANINIYETLSNKHTKIYEYGIRSAHAISRNYFIALKLNNDQ